MSKKMMPKHKKQFMKESIDWLLNNDPGNPGTVDDVTAESFAELLGIQYDGRPLTSIEKKRKSMQETLTGFVAIILRWKMTQIQASLELFPK